MSAVDRFFEARGSTRIVGVMRILAVLVTWSRFGAGMVPAFAEGPVDVGLGIGFWVASGLAFVGLFARPAILLTGLAVFATHLLHGVWGGNPNLASHHVFAQGLLCCLIALTPCGRSFSVDHLRTGLPERAQTWGQTLIKLQVTVLYLGAIYEKSYLGWLDGSRLQHVAMQVYFGADLPQGAWFWWATAGGAIGTWVIELALALLIWVPRARVPALLLGFVFHGLVYLFTPVATFTVTMFVFLLSALDGDEVESRLRSTVAEGIEGRRWGLVLLPLAVLPLLNTLGAGLPVATYESLNTLGESTCEVHLERNGRVQALPPEARSRGLDGVKRAAYRVCRNRGRVDLIGRCGSEQGWEAVELRGWCERPPPAGPARRVSAR